MNCLNLFYRLTDVTTINSDTAAAATTRLRYRYTHTSVSLNFILLFVNFELLAIV
jgi:hypothetical protein